VLRGEIIAACIDILGERKYIVWANVELSMCLTQRYMKLPPGFKGLCRGVKAICWVILNAYSCVCPNNGTSIIGFNIECTGNWKERWWRRWGEADEILPFILPGSQIINKHQQHNQ